MSSIKKAFESFYKIQTHTYNELSKAEVKAIRKLYNLSQRSFAEMLDINLRTLQDYELGRINPSQTAIALFNFAKTEMKTFIKYRSSDSRPFER
jgi:DNA-binding transcriptional regulator YiaG